MCHVGAHSKAEDILEWNMGLVWLPREFYFNKVYHDVGLRNEINVTPCSLSFGLKNLLIFLLPRFFFRRRPKKPYLLGHKHRSMGFFTCVAAFDTHEAILLYFWVPHVPQVICPLRLILLQVPWPHVVGPVNLTHHPRRHDQGLHFCKGELEADDVELPLTLWLGRSAPFLYLLLWSVDRGFRVLIVIILFPLFHCHLAIFLCLAVHHIHSSTRTNQVLDIYSKNNKVQNVTVRRYQYNCSDQM